MKNYKITIQYDGTRYNGWQRQGNTKNTIQEKFENILLHGRYEEIQAIQKSKLFESHGLNEEVLDDYVHSRFGYYPDGDDTLSDLRNKLNFKTFWDMTEEERKHWDDPMEYYGE